MISMISPRSSPLYAVIGKLRLFASKETIDEAQSVMDRILDKYYSSNEDFRASLPSQHRSYDILLSFTKACRRDLNV